MPQHHVNVIKKRQAHKSTRRISKTPSMVSSVKVSNPPWKALFNFTTKKHVALLVPGIFCSIGSGLVNPINSYLLGKIFARFASFASGQLDSSEFRREVLKYNLYIVVVASASWLFNFLAYFIWHTFGEAQARSAREKIFNSLLLRQVEWFDRRKDGIAALSTRILQ